VRAFGNNNRYVKSMPFRWNRSIDYEYIATFAGNDDTGRGREQFQDAQGFRSAHDVDGDEATAHVAGTKLARLALRRRRRAKFGASAREKAASALTRAAARSWSNFTSRVAANSPRNLYLSSRGIARPDERSNNPPDRRTMNLFSLARGLIDMQTPSNGNRTARFKMRIGQERDRGFFPREREREGGSPCARAHEGQP